MKVVYGITSTHQVPATGIAVSGLAGQGLEVVAHNGIAAIVSDAPPFDYASLPKQQLVKVLSQHQYTTEQIMRATATLLPVKFGTLLNRRDVEKMLAQACPDFTQALDLLKGNTEVELIVMWDPQLVFVELAQTPEIAELRSLAAGLPPEQIQQLQIAVGVRVKQLLDARREQIAQIVQSTLANLATDVEANAIVNDQVVANFAFLLPVGSQSEFERRVESLDEQFDGKLTFKVVGPLPPYSFGTVAIEHLLPEDIAWAQATLGLGAAATGEQIRAAYLQEARLAHPDNNPQDEQAAQHFNEVNTAYRMLKSCAEYDRRASAPSMAASDYRCDFEKSAQAGVLVVSISRSSELVARGKTA